MLHCYLWVIQYLVCHLLVDLCLLMWMDGFFLFLLSCQCNVCFFLPASCCFHLLHLPFSLVFNPLMFSQKLPSYFFLLAVSITHSLKYADIFKATSITHLLRVLGKQLFIFMLGRVLLSIHLECSALLCMIWKTDDPLLMTLTCPWVFNVKLLQKTRKE